MDVLRDITNDVNNSPCQCSILTVQDIPGATLSKEPEKCKKSELEFWLKCRGLKVKKSETKNHLCDRVRRAIQSTTNYQIVDPDPGKCHLLRKQMNCSSCQVNNISNSSRNIAPSASVSSTLPIDGWTRSTDHLPKIFSHINLTDHAKNSGKNQKYVEKPIEKGYKFFWDGYVHSVLCTSNGESTHVKAKCYRSQKKHELPHNLSVKLDKQNGNVSSGNCSCVAGVTGHCNHIFALLYAIDHAKKIKLDNFPMHSTCTQKPAEWSKTRTDGVSAEPIMECTVVKPKYGKSSVGIQSTLYDARSTSLINESSEDNGKDLISSLSQLNHNFGIFSVINFSESAPVKTRMGFSASTGSVLSYQLSITESNFKVHENIEKSGLSEVNMKITESLPPFPWQQNPAPDIDANFHNIVDVKISADDSVILEQETREQNSSEKWFAERRKRLTASKFGHVLQRKTTKNEVFVRNTLIGKKDLSHVVSVKYGLDNENKAVCKYLQYMNRARNTVKCYKSGFVVNSDYPWAGASPDRKVLDTKYGFGLLEVKCAYKMKDILPYNACDDPSFFCEKSDGLPKLKRSHHYYAQVQGQMGICGAQWCDFVVYTNKGLTIERIPFDREFFDIMMPNLKNFYVQHMIPVIGSTAG